MVYFASHTWKKLAKKNGEYGEGKKVTQKEVEDCTYIPEEEIDSEGTTRVAEIIITEILLHHA